LIFGYPEFKYTPIEGSGVLESLTVEDGIVFTYADSDGNEYPEGEVPIQTPITLTMNFTMPIPVAFGEKISNEY